MAADFWTLLITPSPIMRALLLLLPVLVMVSGIFGVAERETGTRRLSVWAAAMVIWLFLPVSFHDTQWQQLSGMISMLGWLGLVAYWARQVWVHRPTPVWGHALVIANLVAILIACVVAVIRAWAHSV
ncbi:MAG: hypothetical protein WAT09_08245 [Paracoccaceae bacterium]